VAGAGVPLTIFVVVVHVFDASDPMASAHCPIGWHQSQGAVVGGEGEFSGLAFGVVSPCFS
jgi:hypothetical protein